MVTAQDERPARLMSARQAAEYLGLSRERVRRAIACGQLPSVTIGVRRMVPMEALRRVLAEGMPVSE
jgi:excisionase family DNA binding protein